MFCGITVRAESVNGRILFITGVATAIVKENGHPDSVEEEVCLAEQQIEIFFLGNGQEKSIQTYTDESGRFVAELVVEGEGVVWAEITAENEACEVWSGNTVLKGQKYKYKSDKIRVDENEESAVIEICIDNEKYSGAFSISQTIYQMNQYLEKEYEIDMPDGKV